MGFREFTLSPNLAFFRLNFRPYFLNFIFPYFAKFSSRLAVVRVYFIPTFAAENVPNGV